VYHVSLCFCRIVILVQDSWVNRLVYILRENISCTEELNWILGYPQRFGLLKGALLAIEVRPFFFSLTLFSFVSFGRCHISDSTCAHCSNFQEPGDGFWETLGEELEFWLASVDCSYNLGHRKMPRKKS